MSTINVTARQWSGGWELEIDDDNITQVRTLAKARDQVVDYLDTVDPSISHDEWDIHIIPDLGQLTDKILESKRTASEAAELQIEAAKRSREVVRELRARNLSISDVAAVLDISRGRVSQLEHDRRA